VPGTALYAVATGTVALAGANAVLLLLLLFAATALGYVAVMGVFLEAVSEWFSVSPPVLPAFRTGAVT
jgi:hypothetical protein